MNTALYPWNESTLWVDSQKCRLGSYYGGFFPNYCEYKLRVSYCVTYFEIVCWLLKYTKFWNRIPLLRSQVLPKRTNHHGISTSKAYFDLFWWLLKYKNFGTVYHSSVFRCCRKGRTSTASRRPTARRGGAALWGHADAAVAADSATCGGGGATGAAPPTTVPTRGRGVGRAFSLAPFAHSQWTLQVIFFFFRFFTDSVPGESGTV